MEYEWDAVIKDDYGAQASVLYRRNKVTSWESEEVRYLETFWGRAPLGGAVMQESWRRGVYTSGNSSEKGYEFSRAGVCSASSEAGALTESKSVSGIQSFWIICEYWRECTTRSTLSAEIAASRRAATRPLRRTSQCMDGKLSLAGRSAQVARDAWRRRGEWEVGSSSASGGGFGDLGRNLSESRQVDRGVGEAKLNTDRL
jgi:hypothetical protein